MDAEKAEAVEVIQQFLESLSSNPPFFHQAVKYTRPDSWCVASYPDGSFTGRIGDFIAKEEKEAEKLRLVGKSSKKVLAESSAEVWIDTDLAAVFAPYKGYVNDEEAYQGLVAFGLHYTDGQWKISGIAQLQTGPGNSIPAVSKTPNPEAMQPVYTILECVTSQDWDKMKSVLLPGGGITNSRRGQKLVFSSTWDELTERMKGVVDKVPPHSTIREIISNVEVRMTDGFGFIWAPFVIDLDGKTTAQGSNIFTVLETGGTWYHSQAASANALPNMLVAYGSSMSSAPVLWLTTYTRY